MKKDEYIDFNGFTLQAGVTLLALVVTIVVLLILAGVTITYVFRENGILSGAQSSSTQTDIATTKEQILLSILTNLDGSGKYTIDDVRQAVAEVRSYLKRKNCNNCERK